MVYIMKKFLLFTTLLASAGTAYAVRCSDFATQAEAQRYYEQYRAYHLDRDRDGEACECLPGGSKYGSSRCRRK